MSATVLLLEKKQKKCGRNRGGVVGEDSADGGGGAVWIYLSAVLPFVVLRSCGSVRVARSEGKRERSTHALPRIYEGVKKDRKGTLAIGCGRTFAQHPTWRL